MATTSPLRAPHPAVCSVLEDMNTWNQILGLTLPPTRTLQLHTGRKSPSAYLLLFSLLVEASPQPLTSIYPKSLEYWWKSHPKPPLPSLTKPCQSQKIRQRCSRSLHKVFKLHPRKQTGVFLVSPSCLLSEGLENHQGSLYPFSNLV